MSRLLPFNVQVLGYTLNQIRQLDETSVQLINDESHVLKQNGDVATHEIVSSKHSPRRRRKGRLVHNCSDVLRCLIEVKLSSQLPKLILPCYLCRTSFLMSSGESRWCLRLSVWHSFVPSELKFSHLRYIIHRLQFNSSWCNFAVVIFSS